MEKRQKQIYIGSGKSSVSRRDFIKYSTLTVAASTLPFASGCTSFYPKNACVTEGLATRPNAISKKVFQSSFLKKLSIRNRIIRSATTLNIGDDSGKPTQEYIKRHVELAEGGVGAIITGAAAVQQNGKFSVRNAMMIQNDDCINDFKKFTETIHGYNTAIILQVGHAGRETRPSITGQQLVAPSPIRGKQFKEQKPQALTELQIKEIIENFINAIVRAREAGFDGVQLHGAHGYLLCAFLSENTNRRKDRWGGSLENRFRIIKEIYEGSRKKVGDYPILIKINAYDFQRNGMRLEEAVDIAVLLQNVGCDGIEVSSGVYDDGYGYARPAEIPDDAIVECFFRFRDSSIITKKAVRYLTPLLIKKRMPIENYNVCAAEAIKKRVDIPVIVVGGIKNINDIHMIITQDKADYVAMSRAFIIEPDIVNKFQKQEQVTSNCISCCFCLTCSENDPVICYYGNV